MTQSRPHREILERIAATKNYEQLSELLEPSQWQGMALEDRELLAQLLVAQGELQLQRGDNKVIDSFEISLKIAPSIPAILYKQALCYAAVPHNVRCWALSSEIFEKLIALQPNFWESWYAWGNVLVQLGSFHQEANYFQSADEKFQKAFELTKNDDSLPSSFFWHWGLCWFYLGKQSGEAGDLKQAIEKYQKAADKGADVADFWNDYGNALVDFGCLTGRQELLFDATELYRKALKGNPNDFEAWLNLSCGYQCLYEMAGTESLFALADESFNKAAELDPTDVAVWLKWGVLLATSGRLRRDVSRLQDSLQKFEYANGCEPHHSLVLARWGEAEMWLGSYTDALELLKSSQEKILHSLELAPENANIWYLYGACLHEEGRYFNDEDYDILAIEKFEYGLTNHPKDPLLWYGLAISTFAIGDFRNDENLLKESISYFKEASDKGGCNSPRLWNDWGVALMKLTEVTNEKHFLENALEKFERAIQMQGGEMDITGVDPETLYNYGCALDFLGDFTESERHYERAVQVLSQVVTLDPDYVHARYNLALAWSHLGEITADIDCFIHAIEHFQAIAILDSEDELAWNDWGLTLLNLAQLVHEPSRPDVGEKYYEQAELKFFQAAALGNIHTYYNLACLYSLKGNLAMALQYIEKAEKADALPPLEDLLHDEWLEAFRETAAFREFITQVSKKSGH